MVVRMDKRYLIFCLALLVSLIMISVPYLNNDTKSINDDNAELHSIDSDGDHLPDYIEIEMGTDPENPDSDEDYLNDIEEVYLGTSPLNWDTDGEN